MVVAKVEWILETVLELEIKLVSEEETDKLEDTKVGVLEDSDEAEVALEPAAEVKDKVSLKRLELAELLVVLGLYELTSVLDDSLSELAEETI